MRKSVPGFAVLLTTAAVSYSIVTGGGAIGLSAALAASSEVANPNLPAQTRSARGVTIKVTPKNLASNAGSWEFAIGLDTHSQDLSSGWRSLGWPRVEEFGWPPGNIGFFAC